MSVRIQWETMTAKPVPLRLDDATQARVAALRDKMAHRTSVKIRNADVLRAALNEGLTTLETRFAREEQSASPTP